MLAGGKIRRLGGSRLASHAGADYAPGSAGAALQLATGEQVIDFGPIFILGFGPGYDVSKLPHN